MTYAQVAQAQNAPIPGPRAVRAVIVQPQWHVEDFATPQSFERWMRGQLEQAKTEFVEGRPNLVVLTELNGVGLYLRGSRLARFTGRFDYALGLNLFQRFPEAAYRALTQKVSLVRGLVLTLAPDVLAEYVPLCSKLAKEYKVWLVCGSAPLPHLTSSIISSGQKVRIDGSDVYNESLVFSPQGLLVGAADKVYLTALERKAGLDFSAGRLEDLKVIYTPAGDLGIAISLDAFKPELIKALEKQGADVLVQPDANGSPWTGREQEGPLGGKRDQPEAWLESAWQAVQRSKSLRYALNPMVVGNFLDASFDGQSAIVAKEFEAQKQQSYVMTPPRAGFLALLPWVAEGSDAELRELGRKLSSGSGHSFENRYLTGVLSADLKLQASSAPPNALRPFEAALDALGQGAVLEKPWSGWRWVWPSLWGLLALWGVVLRFKRKRRGWILLLLGILGGVMTQL